MRYHLRITMILNTTARLFRYASTQALTYFLHFYYILQKLCHWMRFIYLPVIKVTHKKDNFYLSLCIINYCSVSTIARPLRYHYGCSHYGRWFGYKWRSVMLRTLLAIIWTYGKMYFQVDTLVEKLATEIMNEEVTKVCKLTYGKSVLHLSTTGLFDQVFEDSLRLVFVWAQKRYLQGFVICVLFRMQVSESDFAILKECDSLVMW